MDVHPVTKESIAAAKQAQARERAASGIHVDEDGRIDIADNGEPDPERKPAC